MSEAAIQKIVCMAVINTRFQSKLLGEERAEVLHAFALDPREEEGLLAIHAETIEEFAAGVERLIRGWRRADFEKECAEPVSVPGWFSLQAPPKPE